MYAPRRVMKLALRLGVDPLHLEAWAAVVKEEQVVVVVVAAAAAAAVAAAAVAEAEAGMDWIGYLEGVGKGHPRMAAAA